MPADHIRAAVPTDAAALARISSQAPDSWQEQSFMETMSQDVAMVLVAEDTGAGRGVCGYAVIYYDEDGSELVQIAVDQDRRREHIASRLLDRVFTFLREKMIPQIRLEVRSGNRAAIALYGRYGFECIHVMKDFYRNPGEDALVMLRKL